jgi:hypothetical protein
MENDYILGGGFGIIVLKAAPLPLDGEMNEQS